MTKGRPGMRVRSVRGFESSGLNVWGKVVSFVETPHARISFGSNKSGTND